jgi:hypothetical protein
MAVVSPPRGASQNPAIPCSSRIPLPAPPAQAQASRPVNLLEGLERSSFAEYLKDLEERSWERSLERCLFAAAPPEAGWLTREPLILGPLQLRQHGGPSAVAAQQEGEAAAAGLGGPQQDLAAGSPMLSHATSAPAALPAISVGSSYILGPSWQEPMLSTPPLGMAAGLAEVGSRGPGHLDPSHPHCRSA